MPVHNVGHIVVAHFCQFEHILDDKPAHGGDDGADDDGDDGADGDGADGDGSDSGDGCDDDDGGAEMEKRADIADISVLFFLGCANLLAVYAQTN